MRRSSGLFFRLLTRWLSVASLLWCSQSFGQTAAPVAEGTATYNSKQIAGFRILFGQVVALESEADNLKAQGKNDTAVRRAIQKDARLSDQNATLLKQVAQQCKTSYGAETAYGTGIMNGLRNQYHAAAGTPPPAAVQQQITALEGRRDAIIAGCMQQLQAGMGIQLFRGLTLYALVRVGGGANPSREVLPQVSPVSPPQASNDKKESRDMDKKLSDEAVPTCEVSVYAGPLEPGDEFADSSYGAKFNAYLGYLDDTYCDEPLPGELWPGEVVEDVSGIGSDCIDPNTLTYFEPDIMDGSYWFVCADGSYTTCDGLDDTYYDKTEVERMQLSFGDYNSGFCYLWYSSQSLAYHGSQYWYNDLGIMIDGSTESDIGGRSPGLDI